MKKLLLFLLLPAGFIGAMQPQVRFAPQVIAGTQLLEIHNRSGKNVAVVLVRGAAGGPGAGMHDIFPGMRLTANWAINMGDKLKVRSGGQILLEYTPSGKTPFVDLIINDNEARMVPAGQ